MREHPISIAENKTAQGLHVVIEARDPKTRCIRHCANFVVVPEEFRRITLIDELIEIQNTPHPISSTQLSELKSYFAFDFDEAENDELTVRGWHWLDSLPYKSHTGRELALMVRGEKPLAAFSLVMYDGREEDIFAEEVFDEYVKEGLFVKFQDHFLDEAHPYGPIKIRHVFYAQKKEAWRINALVFLRQITNKIPWNDSFERIEGGLLGYSEDQINAYLILKQSSSGQNLW